MRANIFGVRILIKPVKCVSIELNLDIVDELTEQTWEVCLITAVVAIQPSK